MASQIYSNDSRAIVNQLVKARLAAQLTQQDVAKLLRKTQSFVSKVESGQRRIDLMQLKELAKIYKKNLTYFIKI